LLLVVCCLLFAEFNDDRNAHDGVS
jgi:hypothetical protein